MHKTLKIIHQIKGNIAPNNYFSKLKRLTPNMKKY